MKASVVALFSALLVGAAQAGLGDDLLSSGDFAGAIRAFDADITKTPYDYLMIYKRSAAQLSLGKDSAALGDLNQVLLLKPDFETALVRRAKVYLRMGRFDEAKKDASKIKGAAGAGLKEDIAVARAASEACRKAHKKNDLDACQSQASIALELAPSHSEIRRIRGQCRIASKSLREGVSDLSKLGSAAKSEDYVETAQVLYYGLDDYSNALQQLKRCLQFDQDDKICKESSKSIRKLEKKLKPVRRALEGNLVSGHPVWEEVEATLTGTTGSGVLLLDAIDEATKTALHSKEVVSDSQLRQTLDRALCDSYFFQKKYSQGHSVCTKVVARDPAHVNGVLLNAEVSIEAEDYDQAFRIIQDAVQNHQVNDQRLNQKAHEVRVLAARAAQKDYYKMLDVPRNADAKEIKKAYRQKTKEYHPDKYRGDLSAEEVEKKMADINEAYEVLYDEENRAKYDRGENPMDPNGGGPQFRPGGPGGNPFQGGFQQFHQFQGQGGFPFEFGQFKFQ